MKSISYIKDLFECFRLRCENAWLRNKIRREQGEEALKEVEAEVAKKHKEMSLEKRED